jgi:hypothetical protein
MPNSSKTLLESCKVSARCRDRASRCSSPDRSIGAQCDLGIVRRPAFLCRIHALVAPASAASGVAILSGFGSLVVALDSIIARRRRVAVDRGIADLTSRLNQLETAERRRLTLEVAQATKRRGGRRGQPIPSSAAVDMAKVLTSLAERTEPAQ